MSDSLDKGLFWLREFVTDGVEASGKNNPSKDDGRPYVTAVDDRFISVEGVLAAGVKWVTPARVASTANVTLASAVENGDTIDGVVLATSDRVLLKNQTAGAENGVWVVAASGAPTRATDADDPTELLGLGVFVRSGTANGGKQFVCTTPAPIVVGTTALTFQEISDQTALNASLAAVEATVATFEGRVAATENEVKPVAIWNEGIRFYYDHSGLTGAAVRTLYCPLSFNVRRGDDTLVTATLSPASSRLSTHFEFVIGASNTTAYFVYFDTADGLIKSIAQTSMTDTRGTKELIAVIANGQVHQARFEIVNLLNDIPWGQIDFAVQERDTSTGRNDMLVLPLLRSLQGSAINLTSPDAGRFYKTYTSFGSAQIETICIDFARFKAGSDPYVRNSPGSTTLSQPNNRLMIELVRGAPGGIFTSRVGLKILGEGADGVVRNQVETGYAEPPDNGTLPNWTNSAANAPTYETIDDTYDPGSVARALGFTKGWRAPNTANKQILVGGVVRGGDVGTYCFVRIWAMSPSDNVYDTAGLLAQSTSDQTSIGITFTVERVFGTRLFTVSGWKRSLHEEQLVGVRAGWNTATNRYMIIGIQAAAGFQSPNWIMWNDFVTGYDQRVFIPRKWNWFSDKKMPFNYNEGRENRQRFQEQPRASIGWKYVDKSDAGFVDLNPFGTVIDTSIVSGDCEFFQDRLNDNPGVYDYVPFELEVASTTALSGKTLHYLGIGDSTSQATGKAGHVKRLCERYGATFNAYGSFADTDWDAVLPATLNEGRTGKKLADYAGYEFGALTIVASDAEWVSYIAGDNTYRRARNPFLRLWVGGDPEADKRHNDIDGLDYIVDFGRYITKMGWSAVALNLIDFTMVFNDLGSTLPPDSWNNMLAAMDDFYRSCRAWALSVGRLQTTHIQFTMHQMAHGDVVTTNSYKWNFRHRTAYRMMLDWFDLNSASAAAQSGGNTGNGTVSDIKVRSTSVVGIYTIDFTSATAFTVKYPDTTTVGTGSVGTRFVGGGIDFLITAGTVAFTASDAFDLIADKCLHLNPGHLTCSVMAGWDSQAHPQTGRRVLSASGQIHTRDANTIMLAMESAAIMAMYA